jgi:hypothetical protein
MKIQEAEGKTTSGLLEPAVAAAERKREIQA